MKVQSSQFAGLPLAPTAAAKPGGGTLSPDQAASDTFQKQPGDSGAGEMARGWAKARDGQPGQPKAAVTSPSNSQEMADHYHAKAEGYGLGLVVGTPFVSSFMGVMATTLTHSLGLGVAAGLIFPVGMLAAYVHYSDKADAFEKLANPSEH